MAFVLNKSKPFKNFVGAKYLFGTKKFQKILVEVSSFVLVSFVSFHSLSFVLRPDIESLY
jgi:hypothetical protein